MLLYILTLSGGDVTVCAELTLNSKNILLVFENANCILYSVCALKRVRGEIVDNQVIVLKESSKVN